MNPSPEPGVLKNTPGSIAKSPDFIQPKHSRSSMTCRAASDKRVFVRQWVLWALLAPGIGSCVNIPVEIIGTFPLGVKLNWSPFALLGMLATIVLAAVLFSTFSLIVACIVKTRERFMGIGQVLTMPLFFASNANYPTAIMPAWLNRRR